MTGPHHDYVATIVWVRAPGAGFTDNRYSRAHRWCFDGGATVAASSSPNVVPIPLSDPAAVDPEEAFIASLSSCHMLFFLSLAAQQGFIVERYEDAATGRMGKNAQGQMVMLKVALRPRIEFVGERRPTADEVMALHHRSHAECFIANSVITEVVVEASVVASVPAMP